jgi:hypothetical protein
LTAQRDGEEEEEEEKEAGEKTDIDSRPDCVVVYSAAVKT